MLDLSIASDLTLSDVITFMCNHNQPSDLGNYWKMEYFQILISVIWHSPTIDTHFVDTMSDTRPVKSISLYSGFLCCRSDTDQTCDKQNKSEC